MNRFERIAGVAAFALLLIALPGSSRATDWQPISPEDLALKDNPKQPGADAMILYRQVTMDASKASSNGDTVEEYIRIKVFTKEGTKEGHVDIEFVKEREAVSYITGRTIHPDGSIVKFDGQVLETTLEKFGGIKVLAKSFTLPDVQPGCIIEYIYQRQGKPGWVTDREWKVSQPMYTREANFTYIPFPAYGTELIPMYSGNLLPPGAAPTMQTNGSFRMTVHDIPAVVEEPLMPPERAIEARVTFYYGDASAPAATDPSDRYWNYYAKKWGGWLDHFVDKKSALNAEISKIVSPGDSPEAKLRKIYARVLQIRNLNMEDEKTAKEHKDENLKLNSNVEDVLKHDYANEYEINDLFIGLARAAGFEATEVHLAPRNAELFLPKRNDVNELRAQVVWVRAGSQEYYLNPAARYYPFGILPWSESGTGGIRVDGHMATVVYTPDSPSSDATMVRSADLDVKDDGSISGVLRVDYTGQRAGLLREEKRKEDETGRTKDLEDSIKADLPAGSEFTVTKITDWDNFERPIHVEGNLKIPSFANSAAQRLLMPLEVFQMSQMKDFASGKRTNAIYFQYRYEELDDIRLRLPSGYRVESMPKPQKVDLGAVSYEISATAQGDTVEMKRHLAEKGLAYSLENYSVLRSFFSIVRTNDNAQMVLQNAPAAKNN